MNIDFVIQLWDRVRTSLWFVPALLVASALGLAALTPLIDVIIPDAWVSGSALVFSGRAAGARSVLSTIATSTIGVAGVVFSMTIVSLQLASSQFGPRLLRTFLRDRGNQFVLGTFLGTFVYCIVVLPTVDTSGESVFVPHIAVTIAVLLSIASLAMLVYYIDHVAQSIHADAVMHALGKELEGVIDNLFPEDVGAAGQRERGTSAKQRGTHVSEIRAEHSGYIRFINADQLFSAAKSDNLYVRVRRAPGQFATHGDTLAEVWADEQLGDRVSDVIRDAFLFGAHRTTLQDILFPFEQVAEVAMRAMSPGINDPTTAVHGIDRIGAGIAKLVTRKIPEGVREDEDGTPRLRINPVELNDILEASVVAISRTAGVHLQVWLRLVEVLQAADVRAKRPADRATLRACAARFAEHARTELACSDDRQMLVKTAAWATDDFVAQP